MREENFDMDLNEIPKKYPNVPYYLTAFCVLWAVLCIIAGGFWEGLGVAAPMLTGPAVYWVLVVVDKLNREKR